MNLSGEPCVELKAVGGISDIKFRLGEGLAATPDLELGQMGGVRTDLLGDQQERFGTIEGAQISPGPVVESRASCADRLFYPVAASALARLDDRALPAALAGQPCLLQP